MLSPARESLLRRHHPLLKVKSRTEFAWRLQLLSVGALESWVKMQQTCLIEQSKAEVRLFCRYGLLHEQERWYKGLFNEDLYNESNPKP